jgi:hypothetical protein
MSIPQLLCAGPQLLKEFAFGLLQAQRSAASVSLIAAAVRFRVAMLSPTLKYCAGLGKASSVSSGVW